MSNKAVFWDRDGTLIKHHDYLTDVNDVVLIRGASSAIKYLKDRGYKAIVVTNQSAVARGMITEKELSDINRRFTSMLIREGAYIDKLYYCPFHPEAPIEEYRQDSDLRKPSPGMILKAAAELDLDLSQCWMVGDDDRDILAGQAAGCRTILIQTRSTELVRRGNSKPDYVACNPQEAANIVAHYSSMPEPEPELESEPESAPDEKTQSEDLPAEVSPEPEVNSDLVIENNIASKDPVDEVIEPEVVEVVNKQTDISPEVPEPANVVKQVEKTEPVIASNNPRKKKKHKKQSVSVISSSVEPEPRISDRRQVSDNQLLQEILRELKHHNIREEDAKADFSGASLLAGITQIIVLLCLLMAYIATGGIEPSYDKIQAWLLAGLVSQAMTISLLMMNK